MTQTSAKESHSERHKQNSNTQSTSDLEPGFRKDQGQANAHNHNGDLPSEPQQEQGEDQTAENPGPDRRMPEAAGLPADMSGRSVDLSGLGTEAFEAKPVPLGLVRQACPDIAAYAKNSLASWSELMGAAIVVRSMLGVSPSAYEEACAVLGQENAAIAMACILQRADQINSAGGYLRSLTDKAAKGEFSVWPMLLAQIRANGSHVRLVKGQLE